MRVSHAGLYWESSTKERRERANFPLKGSEGNKEGKLLRFSGKISYCGAWSLVLGVIGGEI